MAKTVVEKVASPKPDVSIFKISGVLGYHENEVLTKFFSECSRKNITKLILEFSDLGSLGGGCAKIIREAAVSGEVIVCLVGASTTVRNFLEKAGETPILYVTDLDAALAAIDATPVPKKSAPAASANAPGGETPQRAGARAAQPAGQPLPAGRKKPDVLEAAVALEDGDMAAGATQPAGGKTTPQKAPPKAPRASDPEHDRELERRLVQYRSLFSLNSDFNRIQEKGRLLDAFLLTTIAQAGTESAAFLERDNNAFKMIAWKGFETADPKGFTIGASDVDEGEWMEAPKVVAVKKAPLAEAARKKLVSWGMPYIGPFVVHGHMQGLVLLGNPIRRSFDDSTFDYLGILINQAAIAYQNSLRFEQESKRTLGLVQSLISMIEENTLSRGSTETIINYIHAVAVSMHYPEEHVRDLIYGTVLRDIGMIKVSDLIVRSPRELQDEEWEIIKQHPIEGSEMLRNMNFSEHTSNIVLYHHERFNGQGYPHGAQGTQIPLGARIVSVVESYAAMLQDRPTRPALSTEEATNTLKENWGMRYDPDVIAKFVEIIEEEIRTGKKVVYEGSNLFKG